MMSQRGEIMTGMKTVLCLRALISGTHQAGSQHTLTPLHTHAHTRYTIPNRRDRGGSGRWRELRDCWAESFCLRGKMTEQSTKLKLYVAFVRLNLAITEA